MSQCKATVIAHSKSSVTGKEIFTFELEFPRIILAEFNTHNALSKNASSSRAIPVPTMLKQVRETPAMPVRFGGANTGMQDKGAHDSYVLMPDLEDIDGGYYFAKNEEAWSQAANTAASLAQAFHDAGYAKQICNRLIEPFQMMKVVMTATELNNFFWLRDHDAADPTIAQLARVIKAAYDASKPTVLQPGEWHVPYYNTGFWIPHHTTEDGVIRDVFGNDLDHALVISASCCAQVSYRKLDDTIEKARGVVARLNLKGEEPDQPVHASPLEHQATPIEKTWQPRTKIINGREVHSLINIKGEPDTWQEGITHMDRDGQFGSGNLKGFIQHRQLVSNHVKAG